MSDPNRISDAEAEAMRNQPRVKMWQNTHQQTVAVLDNLTAHEWPVAEDGLHEASPKCVCEPIYAGIAGRMQFWCHENPVVGIRLRRGLLPVAMWVERSTVLHTSWGWTKDHAGRRAARWGRENRKMS